VDENSLLIRQPEAARLLGISMGVLRLIIASGRLKTVVLHPGAHPRVRRADVEALALHGDCHTDATNRELDQVSEP